MMLKYYILDEEHRPIRARDAVEWAKFFENTTNRIVDWTQINSQVEVSTIFIGIDHRILGSGPPILFETMVFGADDDSGEMARYSSWDDAVAGHSAIVKRLRAKVRA